jgi:hypothetical protein
VWNIPPTVQREHEPETISHLHRSAQACAGLIVSGVSKEVGIHKSVYVRAADVELWRRAEAYARERRMTTSGLVMLALERYLNEVESEPRGDNTPR